MKIIGFAGPAGSGKDTCANIIKEFGYTGFSFAGPLKAGLTAMGFPEPKTQDEKEQVIPWIGVSYRHLAQTLGTEWGRHLINPDIWVLAALAKLEAKGHYVVSDVRFLNEAVAIRSMGGKVVHLRGRRHTMTGSTQTHASETGVAVEVGDLQLDNSVDDLKGLHGALWRMLRKHHMLAPVDYTALLAAQSTDDPFGCLNGQ